MLSRKYYKMIAKVIKDNTIGKPRVGEQYVWKLNKDTLIDDLCAEFKADNGLFNKQTFVDACDFGCDDECDFK